MTIYNVHIYREMRLKFEGIEANSHEEAAVIARDKPTEQAESIDDCEGLTHAALVDVQGDQEYEHSRTIDFEEERMRKAAPKLLEALLSLDWLQEGGCSDEAWNEGWEKARAAIAEAESTTIPGDTERDVIPPDGPPPSDPAPYFRGASGRCYTYAEIADRIRGEAPHAVGKHIFVQLEALGLLEEFQSGTTPCGLPSSFACKSRQVEKRLTSSGLVHTPGLFRALQNDYRIKGATRRRAIQIFSDGYGLPCAEAEGLLSGAIAIAIDDAHGTITYTVAGDSESPTN